MAFPRLVIVVIFASALIVAVPFNSFAQEQEQGWIVKTSGAGSLDIMLEQDWTDNGSARFTISFLNPNTTTLHEHQDYDVLIRQGGNQIFSAAGATNQPLIHNVEGTTTIPYQFEGTGDYTIEVQVLGLNFPPIPINPEVATFPITVVPEFPAGLTGIIAAVVASSVVLTRKFKLF
jgi:hypothetical protein